ncbi:MAG TPA: hypothetical protein VK525_15060 [Candidatus Saccharimonadales bacterium]|nr:hypothetical protein [Candidatus Saccharimonadales bacterium]
MNDQEYDPRELIKSAYENGRIKPVTASALKAAAQLEREVAARVEQLKASLPDLSEEDKNRGFAIGATAYKAALQDDSHPQAVFLRNSIISVMKMTGMLGEWTHDGVLEDKVYELAAVFEMNKTPTRPFHPMILPKFIETLKAQEK